MAFPVPVSRHRACDPGEVTASQGARLVP